MPCEVLELLVPADAKAFSGLYPIFSLPDAFTISLPVYDPSPACGLSNTDVLYEVVGELPEWATFKQDEREVDIDVDDAGLVGTAWPMTFTATYRSITQEITFAVSFIDNTKKSVEPVQEQEEPEPEPEEEPAEEETASATTTGWTGWLSLLDLDTIIPGGIVLPPPNPDPLYVPTPPTATLQTVSEKGSTEILFNEAVFEYPDL